MSETEEQRMERILRQARENTRHLREKELAGERVSAEAAGLRFHSRCESPFNPNPTPEQLNEYWRNY